MVIARGLQGLASAAAWVWSARHNKIAHLLFSSLIYPYFLLLGSWTCLVSRYFPCTGTWQIHGSSTSSSQLWSCKNCCTLIHLLSSAWRACHWACCWDPLLEECASNMEDTSCLSLLQRVTPSLIFLLSIQTGWVNRLFLGTWQA